MDTETGVTKHSAAHRSLPYQSQDLQIENDCRDKSVR